MASEITAAVIVEVDPPGRALPHTAPLAVVACVAPERHTLGAQALQALLASQEWRVAFLGAETPVGFLVDFVAFRAPKVVLLSVKSPEAVPAARSPRPNAWRRSTAAARGAAARPRSGAASSAARDAFDLVTDDMVEASGWLAERRDAWPGARASPRAAPAG